MDKFYLEKVTYKRKEDIIEYIRELYKFGSRINGVGRLQDYVTDDNEDFPYGHIGYSIRPLERNKGYEKIQLFLALEELKKHNIKMCQMSCDSNNEASRNVILSLGGIFEKNVDRKEYYCIDTYKSIQENKLQYSKYVKE